MRLCVIKSFKLNYYCARLLLMRPCACVRSVSCRRRRHRECRCTQTLTHERLHMCVMRCAKLGGICIEIMQCNAAGRDNSVWGYFVRVSLVTVCPYADGPDGLWVTVCAAARRGRLSAVGTPPPSSYKAFGIVFWCVYLRQCLVFTRLHLLHSDNPILYCHATMQHVPRGNKKCLQKIAVQSPLIVCACTHKNHVSLASQAHTLGVIVVT